MNIVLVTSIGRGKTLLSAFDNALLNAGVHNYNLLPLSSVIPPNSVIKKKPKYQVRPDEFGYKLYVVKAEMRSDKKGEYIASGMGWYQLEDGRGFFVEHELTGSSEQEVRARIEQLIRNSLEDLVRTRNIVFDPSKINFTLSSSSVGDIPACVLTVAAYQSEGWQH